MKIAMVNQYIYDEKAFLQSLIEISDYCKENNIGMTRLEDDGEIYKFDLDLGTDAKSLFSITIKKTAKGYSIINVEIDLMSKHSKFTDPITGFATGAGELVGGGIGIVGSVATPGVGWILGAGITAVTSTVFSIPGRILGGIDNGISKKILESYQKYIKGIFTLFNDNLIDLTDILQKKESEWEKNGYSRDKWINDYLKKSNKMIYTFIDKKKNLIVKFNSYVDKGNDKKIFKNYIPNDSEMIQVLKYRSLKRGELETDLAVVEEVENAWISACVDPIYDEEYEKRYSARAINKSVDELRLELKRRIKY